MLDELSTAVAPGAHAVGLIDRAGWHSAKTLIVPRNLTPLFRPPYSPELNAIERVWLYLRERFLSPRLWPSYDAIRLHRGSAHARQDRGNPGIALRADRAGPIDRLVAQIAQVAWPHALLEPAATEAPGLADPRLVLEPDLEPLGLRVVARDRGDQRREFC